MSVLDLLIEAMRVFPQHRIAQIISNACAFGGWTETDCFYCPNEVLKKGLKIMLDKFTKA